jgi:UDP-3-O-[3-hydroxymyristoyl] glucosamine N-acyltransferase
VIVSPGITARNATLLRTIDPYFAFMKTVVRLHGHRKHPFEGVHPAAHVDPSATLGQGTIVYPGAFIGPRCRLGANCIVYPNATIYEDCIIGERVIIHAGTAVGVDGYGYATHKGEHHKIPQVGNCIIEDDVVLGENVIVEDFELIQSGAKVGSGTKVGTYCKVGRNARIGRNCSFTAYCEIRENCVLGDGVSMGSRCTLSANTIVGDGVIMKYGFVVTDTPVLARNTEKIVGRLGDRSRYGANVTIMPGVVVGTNSEIGACSQVRASVPDNQVWYGSPAKYYRDV